MWRDRVTAFICLMKSRPGALMWWLSVPQGPCSGQPGPAQPQIRQPRAWAAWRAGAAGSSEWCRAVRCIVITPEGSPQASPPLLPLHCGLTRPSASQAPTIAILTSCSRHAVPVLTARITQFTDKDFSWQCMAFELAKSSLVSRMTECSSYRGIFCCQESRLEDCLATSTRM